VAGTRAASAPPVVRRYTRRTWWFHAATYLAVLVLLFTGWWLLAGAEGQPSPLARGTGWADADIHTYAGWVAAALAALAVTLGARAARTFLAESVRVDRGDARWFVRWPAAVFTGRFPRHEGHFDPGQRLANLVLVVLLAALVGSGVGLTLITGGAGFVWLQRVHRWATYLVTPVLIGHILIASGALPGYRGVTRAMHLGGRLRRDVAERVWPGWLDRQDSLPSGPDAPGRLVGPGRLERPDGPDGPTR
jgi:cytochrome b subunit of formate dehydrogenase